MRKKNIRSEFAYEKLESFKEKPMTCDISVQAKREEKETRNDV